ncbi:hypothetical protein MMH89_03620 [Candidatus Comchoanobacter bicostacola]|uniref:Phage tail protein n=1 Tax=Candidatus Comchoanobacter bicostacola TaxID=2919598 RepID=A0ABY5DI43_9GAMM|nr:hypothetical protein [Candidatus Comchoanobacter bicostacola]UTC24313.1 hypothetical protein MMH89_03620 [Candidatus Comchoanobacter bicostacola]
MIREKVEQVFQNNQQIGLWVNTWGSKTMLSRQFILGESNGHSSLEMTVSVSEAYK